MLLNSKITSGFLVILFLNNGLIMVYNVDGQDVLHKRDLFDSTIKGLLNSMGLYKDPSAKILKPVKFGYRCMWKICSRPMNEERKLKYEKARERARIENQKIFEKLPEIYQKIYGLRY